MIYPLLSSLSFQVNNETQNFPAAAIHIIRLLPRPVAYGPAFKGPLDPTEPKNASAAGFYAAGLGPASQVGGTTLFMSTL